MDPTPACPMSFRLGVGDTCNTNQLAAKTGGHLMSGTDTERGSDLQRDVPLVLARGVGIVATVADRTYVGTGPDWAAVLRGPELAVRCWLADIDGRRDAAALLDQAERYGLARSGAELVLNQLVVSGMVSAGGATSKTGSAATVVVVGRPGVAERLVATVNLAVDHSRVLIGARPLRRRGTLRAAAEPRLITQVAQATASDLVVLVLDRLVADVEEVGFADELVSAGVPHLVVAAASVARVGPLVVPGVTACLRCEDLARADRVADWPEIALRWALAAPDDPTEVTLRSVCAEVTRRLEAIADFGFGRLLNESGEAGLLARAQTQSGGGAWEHHHPMRHPECGCWWQDSPPAEPPRVSRTTAAAGSV